MDYAHIPCEPTTFYYFWKVHLKQALWVKIMSLILYKKTRGEGGDVLVRNSKITKNYILMNSGHLQMNKF